jgi:hypothetical protein
MEITAGLTDDDRVITVGQVGLKPDAEVSVINGPDSDAEETAEDAELATAGHD